MAGYIGIPPDGTDLSRLPPSYAWELHRAGDRLLANSPDHNYMCMLDVERAEHNTVSIGGWYFIPTDDAGKYALAWLVGASLEHPNEYWFALADAATTLASANVFPLLAQRSPAACLRIRSRPACSRRDATNLLNRVHEQEQR